MISTVEALEEVVVGARRSGVVALDTEFVWERTFYPRLGVVQLGVSSDDIYLIDTVALTELEPLGQLLADNQVVKILHDAVQDLTILKRATGAAPKNVFDTQRASGFVGLSSTISLQDLVAEAAGVNLPKGETRTNWCKRPLTEKQIAYAENDVRYMPALHTWLSERIESAGREDWFAEEMTRLDDPSLYDETDPRAQFERVKARGLAAFSDTQRAVLRELAAWREEEARASDTTRKGIISDDALADIARRLPNSVHQLPKRTVGDRERNTYGERLIEAVRRGLEIPPGERPRRAPRDPDEVRISTRVQVVAAAIAGRCHREGIDPRMVATKAEIQTLVASTPEGSIEENPLLIGWRRVFIGDDILALLSGEVKVDLVGPEAWPELTR